MRESIGATWLLGLVIAFIIFFSSFLALSVNYSKAFNVKNNIVDFVEKYEGNTCETRKAIGEYLYDVGYLVAGNCPTEKDDDGNVIRTYKGYGTDGNETSGKAYYCISEEAHEDDNGLKKTWFSVIVFFKVDLPIIGDLTTFRIKGETESIYFPGEDAHPGAC